ncbi:unnamed protein product, partial [Linum tenue]
SFIPPLNLFIFPGVISECFLLSPLRHPLLSFCIGFLACLLGIQTSAELSLGRMNVTGGKNILSVIIRSGFIGRLSFS